jgi:hypothetical protein
MPRGALLRTGRAWHRLNLSHLLHVSHVFAAPALRRAFQRRSLRCFPALLLPRFLLR